MPYFLFLIAILAATPAEAAVWEKCGTWFASLGRKESYTPAQFALWEKTFRPQGTHPYLEAANLDSQLILDGFTRLPAEIQAELLHPTPLLAAMRNEFAQYSFLSQAERYIDRFPGGREKLEIELNAYEKKKAAYPNFAAERAEIYAKAERLSHARQLWIKSAGEVELPHEIRGGKTFVKIKGEELEAVQESDGWLLKVPRELMAHRFDNPVGMEKIMNMARAGVKPPKVYEASIGHDGRFYIVDGNHRFEIDSRKTIPVRTSNLSTVNFAVMLDFVGAPQPKIEAIADYLEGKIAWEALLSDAAFQKRFTFPPLPPTRAH